MLLFASHADYVDKHDFLLRSTAVVSAGLSCAGCLFIVIMYIALQQGRLFQLRLILYLTLSNLLYSMSCFVGAAFHPELSKGPEFFCILQGATLQQFSLSSFLWTSAIAITLYQAICRNNSGVARFEYLFHVICWLLPSITVVVCLSIGAFGDAYTWCWIKHDDSAIRFTMFFVPSFLIIIVNSALFIRISIFLHQQSPAEMAGTVEGVRIQRIQRSMLFFVLILILSWIAPVVNRSYEFMTGGPSPFVLYYFQALAEPLQGFLNSIVYGYNDEFRRHIGVTSEEKRKLIPALNEAEKSQLVSQYGNFIEEYEESEKRAAESRRETQLVD